MGTGPSSSDTQKTLTQVFRGLLDILNKNQANLNQTLVAHIRSFDRTPSEQEADINVIGFWRLFLELIFQGYTQFTLALGSTLVLLLVIVTYPLRVISTLFTGMWFGVRHENYVMLSHEDYDKIRDQLDAAEATGEPVKKDKTANDGKVVRRVVYEEAKVSK